MIRSRRTLSALGAHHEVVAWIEKHARLHVMRTQQLTCDDLLYQLAFGRTDAGSRSLVTLVLSGTLWLERGDDRFCCDAGSGVYLPTKGALSVRTEGETYESLVLEWDGVGAGSVQSLSFEVGRLRALARAVCARQAPCPALLGEILDAISDITPHGPRHIGMKGDEDPRELRAQEIADALDAVLSSLEEQPMATDLEARLGVSSRQVTRMVDAFRDRYGYGSANWLETRHRRRLMLAATLLTTRRATVAQVAKAVGYQRPETLARAFATAGLPRPSRIREYVEALGVRWHEGALLRWPTSA